MTQILQLLLLVKEGFDAESVEIKIYMIGSKKTPFSQILRNNILLNFVDLRCDVKIEANSWIRVDM